MKAKLIVLSIVASMIAVTAAAQLSMPLTNSTPNKVRVTFLRDFNNQRSVLTTFNIEPNTSTNLSVADWPDIVQAELLNSDGSVACSSSTRTREAGVKFKTFLIRGDNGGCAIDRGE
jgi:hypothetical protein